MNFTKAWQQVQEWFISSEIRSVPNELMKAQIILGTCLIAGIACLGIIYWGVFTYPEAFAQDQIIVSGHLALIASIFGLKFSATSAPAGRYMAIVGTIQLLSATYLSGGSDSPVILMYPVFPLFLSFVVGLRWTLLASAILMLGTAVIWGAEKPFPLIKVAPVLEFVITLWTILTAVGIAWYAQHRYKKLITQANDEIKERKTAQLELQASKEHLEELASAKDRFLAYLSHEIRNPLTTIVGVSELLSMDRKQEKQEYYLKSLHSASQHLRDLVERVLDYSTLESGQLRLETQRIEWEPILKATHSEFSGQADSAQLYLKRVAHAGTCDHIMADPIRLRQVLSNLVSNALKFTKTGGVQIETSPGNNNSLRISVSDTGIGIPEHQHEHIFDAYQRGNTGTFVAHGTGLGLAICRTLLQQMDSTIHLNSTTNQGSEFWFELPIAEKLEIKSPNEDELDNASNTRH
ncbi:MAG TPA: hypothetical protein EYN66_14360 [Myxococcales bacterium]|nr:hypothetical protein [Myxococcales bacterium]